MIRDYFYNKQREKSEQTLAELKRKEDRFKKLMHQNATKYSPIVDMRKALNDVQTGKHKNVTIDAEYDRLVNSNYKYKWRLAVGV